MAIDCCHEPNSISCDEFLVHQGLLGSGYSYLIQVESFVQSGFDLIVASRNTEVELANLLPYQRSLTAVDPRRTSSLLRDATLALERHISDKSGQSLDDYLFTRGLKVTRSFAELSSRLGVPINALNIE